MVSLFLYVFGRAFDFITLEAAGVWGAAVAMLYAWVGLPAILKHWFPLFYLGFAVPPPNWLIDRLTAPLKQFVSFVATASLRSTGLPIEREGVTIQVAQYQLLVEDACSGMNSLVGLSAISLLYIYLLRGSSVRYSLILTLFIIPIAVLGNILRVMTLILLTYFFGDQVAQGFLHFTAGIFLFAAVDLILVFAVDQVDRQGGAEVVEIGVIARRDLLISSACLAAAGVAYALKPRRNVSLLGEQQLADIIPASFGDWTSQDVGDPLAINGPGTLSAKIYNQLITRLYVNPVTGVKVMALFAYGGQQTDELQLHRPEICYPAFGFALTKNEAIELPVGGGVAIPARRLMAVNAEGSEGVIYWTRLGEYLPNSSPQQRADHLKISMQGIIADGILSRFSTAASTATDSWRELESFIPALMTAVAPQWRKVLIGEHRAAQLAAPHPTPAG